MIYFLLLKFYSSLFFNCVFISKVGQSVLCLRGKKTPQDLGSPHAAAPEEKTEK